MNKWTLQLTTAILLSFAMLFNSCGDAGFEDTETGSSVIKLEGTTWNVIQQKIEIKPSKEIETELNYYFKNRFETRKVEQTFDKNYAITSYYSKTSGEKLYSEELKYTIEKDSIFYLDFVYGEEKGTAKQSGDRIVFNTIIKKNKLRSLLASANLDSNLSDGEIEEIRYIVVADKISK